MTKARLGDDLERLAKFNADGVLTNASKVAIRRRLRAVGREHARTATSKATRKQIETHLGRMERVSMQVFGEQVADMTENLSYTRRLVKRAKSAVKLAREKITARTRNRKLVDDIRAQHLDRVARGVIQTLEKTGSVAKAREAIGEATAFTRRRGDRIAAWETDSIHSAFTQRIHLGLGITEYSWWTQRDDAVRDSHREREGQRFGWDHSHDDGHPGEPPNCRCWAEPVLPDLPAEAA